MKNVSSTTLGWFVGRLPDGWFTAPPEITYDRDEILVVGRLPDPEGARGEDEETRAAARRARIESFREETRDQRMRIADGAEAKFGRKVAWGRSEALAWCVQLVREHEGDWIGQLRDALAHVDEARAAGPGPTTA